MVDARTLDEERPQPRLRLRFALYTGVVLLGVGLAVTWLVNREVAQRAGRTVQAQARAVALTNLRQQLRPSDFARPVSPARRAALDALFRTSSIVPGAVGGRLFSPDGTITYSSRHVRIGHLTHHPQVLRAVLAGRMTQRVTAVTTWRGQKDFKVLQILAPVRPAPSSKPIGVIRVDQDYRAATVSVGDATTRLALILAAALLALFASLLPIMNRLTRQLEARNQRLREQNDRLRELDRLKDEFVSLVSHELRTPLTSIRGYVELLLEDADQAEQRRYLEIVDRNSERLLELVSDLLFLAQIEAGKLGIERSQVDLSKIVEECIEASSPVADARGIELIANVERVPPLQGDRARLAQVLDNLVSNALKFTRSGGRVEVRLTSEAGAAVLEVEDTGVGIPAGEQERLFERFFRSSNAMESATPGTGLGLTITKAIVERHGGRIEIESTENAGTTVRVRLPLEALAGSVPVAEAADGLDGRLAAGRLAELAP